MTAGVDFYWNDTWLRAAAEESYRVGLGESAVLARRLAKWRHVASSISPGADGVVVGSSDAALLEGGAKAHEVGPRDQALRFTHGDGGFSSRPVEHPGFRGSPFMRPTAEAWPATYTQAAKAVFPG